MPPGYEVWLKRPAYEYLDSLDLEEHQRLLEWVVRLKNNPFREGEYTELDEHGREHQVSIMDKHAVSWWVDSPVRESRWNRSVRRALD